MAELKIDSLFAAIGIAMYEAQQAINIHELNEYWRYFKKEPTVKTDDIQEEGVGASETDTAITPVMKRIKIPGFDGQDREIEVPVVSLVNHSSFSLDQVKLRMNIKASVDSNSGALKVSVGPLIRKADQDTEDNAPDPLKYRYVSAIATANVMPTNPSRMYISNAAKNLVIDYFFWRWLRFND